MAPTRSEATVFGVPIVVSLMVALATGLFSDLAAVAIYTMGRPLLIGPTIGLLALLTVLAVLRTSGRLRPELHLVRYYLLGSLAGVLLFVPVALAAAPVLAPVRQPFREAYARSLIAQLHDRGVVGREVVPVRGLGNLLSDDGRVVAYLYDNSSVWFFDFGSDSARVYSVQPDTAPLGSLTPEDRREQLSEHWWIVRR